MSESTTIVLVVEDDNVTRAILERSFAAFPSLAVAGAASVVEGRTLVAVLQPEVAVVDLELGDGLGFEILNALDEQGGGSRAIVVSSFLERYKEQLGRLSKRIHCVSKPANLETLCELVVGTRPVPPKNPFTVTEYVQLAGLGGHAVQLDCVDPDQTEVGSVFMSDGRVRFAVAGRLQGVSAFQVLVKAQGLQVRVRDANGSAGSNNMDQDWQEALLVALRSRLDRSDVEVALPSWSQLPAALTPKTVSGLRQLVRPVTPEPCASRGLVRAAVRAVLEGNYDQAIVAMQSAMEQRPGDVRLQRRLERLHDWSRSARQS